MYMCVCSLLLVLLSYVQVSRAHILNKATEYIRQMQRGGSLREVGGGGGGSECNQLCVNLL